MFYIHHRLYYEQNKTFCKCTFIYRGANFVLKYEYITHMYFFNDGFFINLKRNFKGYCRWILIKHHTGKYFSGILVHYRKLIDVH